jgi:alpha-D-xyloside xylohydrolase
MSTTRRYYRLHERTAHGAIFCGERDRVRVLFVTAHAVRITSTQREHFLDRSSHIVTAAMEAIPWQLEEHVAAYVLRSEHLIVRLTRATGALSYETPDGRVLTREPEHGGRWLTQRRVYRNVFHAASVEEHDADRLRSVDGARAAAQAHTTVFDREAYEARLEFCFAADEALYGLGSHEEGHSNLRGQQRSLYQQNMKAVVPHLVSTRGYGVLMDCCSLMMFHDDAEGSYWWAACVDELDYYLLEGSDHAAVIAQYRRLTGAAPMLPKWVLGYVQSKERYVNADEMLAVAAEYRRRGVPLDVLVLDWKSWPNGDAWGQKSLDPQRFPAPSSFLDGLHAMHVRLMVSIWPIMTGGCADQRELQACGGMLGNGATYNAMDATARSVYWRQVERGLAAHGVDAWWCDCTEPFEADWQGAVKPEPHQRICINTEAAALYLDEGAISAYSLFHSQGIYEGQRRFAPHRRVLNLTRSSYAGQHRYGTVTWNGDVCATWETLRRSIAEGLHFCATGEPYWAVDIGGFFIDHRPELWFWRGAYHAGCRGLTAMNAMQSDPADRGCSDRGYWELYTRWLQFGAFLPMFRSHGTDAAREVWRFGEEGTPFYDALAAAIRMRYRLMPYLYSVMAWVSHRDGSMLQPLGLAFPHDARTHAIGDQFLCGPSLMVCPVTQPMLYGPESRELPRTRLERTVYLPEAPGWYDFHTRAYHAGGETMQAAAPLERIPLFARAGSIVPMTCAMQYVDALPDAPWELIVFTGADATFSLYEDEGDGYAYEDGACAWVDLCWHEQERCFEMRARRGSFRGLVQRRSVTLHVITKTGTITHQLSYSGEDLRVWPEREQG